MYQVQHNRLGIDIKVHTFIPKQSITSKVKSVAYAEYKVSILYNVHTHKSKNNKLSHYTQVSTLCCRLCIYFEPAKCLAKLATYSHMI